MRSLKLLQYLFLVPTRRISRPKTALATKVEVPPIDVILRYPVEVWASAGEKFVKPEKVAADQKEMRHYRKLVSDINVSLQKEKHKLRQLQGKVDNTVFVFCICIHFNCVNFYTWTISA